MKSRKSCAGREWGGGRGRGRCGPPHSHCAHDLAARAATAASFCARILRVIVTHIHFAFIRLAVAVAVAAAVAVDVTEVTEGRRQLATKFASFTRFDWAASADLTCSKLREAAAPPASSDRREFHVAFGTSI